MSSEATTTTTTATTNYQSTMTSNGTDTDEERVLENWTTHEGMTAAQARERERRHPTRNCFHRFCLAVSTLAVLGALCMGLGQFLGIAFQEVGPIQYIVRLYVIILCCLVVLVEKEWTKVGRDSWVFSFWLTRGMFYTFIGVLGLEENDTSVTRNIDSRGFSFSLQYVRIVAWFMVVSGLLYFFMGVAFLQFLYNRQREDFQERLERAKQLRREDREDGRENDV